MRAARHGPAARHRALGAAVAAVLAASLAGCDGRAPQGGATGEVAQLAALERAAA